VPKFQLVLLIHAHQPVGNFDDVLESAYAKSYLPFISTLERHPSIRLGLHYSGSLLEWIERAHPEYFDRLRALVKRGQVEIVGGGFYEPILIAIPPEDRQEQITRFARYIEKHFEAPPTGAWLAERIWEPQLPSTLVPAGVKYTLVDDNHFLGAGFNLEDLYGYYFAEDQGDVVKVLPGLKLLRYLIPFRSVAEITQFLRSAASLRPNGFAAMGDDLEKFGVWPGTHDHCYRNGWLESFFSTLEQNSHWLELCTPAEAVAARPPLGRADLPAASYTEMMEWALPTPARSRYHGLMQEFSSRVDLLPFLRGGIWRNFFSKYCEANLLQKRMLHVSKEMRQLAQDTRRDEKFLEARDRATNLLLQSQCNDSYWHGVFGGLYAPHLRSALWRSLVHAETIVDGLLHKKKEYADATRSDLDGDGQDEVLFVSDRFAVLVKPEDGGTVCSLEFRPAHLNLINSLARRPEAYHIALRNLQAKNAPRVQSIHDQTRTKEEGLERWLYYDRWARHTFRVLLFGREKTLQDYASLRLEEDSALAGGEYRIAQFSPSQVTLASEGSADWSVSKTLTFVPTHAGFDAVCDISLTRTGAGAASFHLGVEAIVNFLAPAATDRYFESNGKRYPLRWCSAASGPELRVVDEWQGAKVTFEAPGVSNFWVAPIETVSESEEGFERIYQGSQVIAVWPVDLATGENWKGQLTLRVAQVASS
jgi:alpha-amylase